MYMHLCKQSSIDIHIKFCTFSVGPSVHHIIILLYVIACYVNDIKIALLVYSMLLSQIARPLHWSVIVLEDIYTEPHYFLAMAQFSV